MTVPDFGREKNSCEQEINVLPTKYETLNSIHCTYRRIYFLYHLFLQFGTFKEASGSLALCYEELYHTVLLSFDRLIVCLGEV